MRINKYLSNKGICSRRQADKYLLDGKVLINGRVALIGEDVEKNDKVVLNGKEVNNSIDNILIAYNKARGVICTEYKNEKGIKISDKIKELGFPYRLFTIGRLDKESEGLILLTNNGDYAQELTNKNKKHEKEYIVLVDKIINQTFLRKMANGMYLKDINKITKKAKVSKIDDYTFDIIITEGLNRQIRRMCYTLGYRVKSLKRIRIDNITLGNLKVGEYKIIEKDM